MRTCMYCGKDLAAGEVCDCPQSVMRREAKASDTKETTAEEPKQKKTSYKTGYAGGDSRFEQARNKYNAKRAAKKNKANSSNFIKDLWQFVVSFVKAPTDAIANPGRLGVASMLTLAAITGALLWLCVFFILRGGAVGPFKLLASAMSFGGIEGYKLIAAIGIVILSGAVGGIIVFFIYTGIFYLINRFILRMKTPYWGFCTRLAAAWLPITIISLIGTVISILSPITLAALLACAAAMTALLTFEGLKTEWISVSPSKVMYCMFLGYFVFITIMAHIIFI